MLPSGLRTFLKDVARTVAESIGKVGHMAFAVRIFAIVSPRNHVFTLAPSLKMCQEVQCG